ncbi:MAG: hypothetical protein IH609_15860 [Dehalococcoidia bacterium]|nr:hypothetical protein [Dehalococcoidia bacterium]
MAPTQPPVKAGLIEMPLLLAFWTVKPMNVAEDAATWKILFGAGASDPSTTISCPVASMVVPSSWMISEFVTLIVPSMAKVIVSGPAVVFAALIAERSEPGPESLRLATTSGAFAANTWGMVVTPPCATTTAARIERTGQRENFIFRSGDGHGSRGERHGGFCG